MELVARGIFSPIRVSPTDPQSIAEMIGITASMISSSNGQDCQRKQYCSVKQKLHINWGAME
jgi:hypothetical protein